MNVTPIRPARRPASRLRGRSLGPLVASICVALAGSASAQTISVQPESPSGLSRGELVIGQAVGGLLDGALFCVATECDSSQSFAAMALLSTSASLGIGMLTFPHGVTAGQAAAVNAGTWIGTWNGLAFAGLVDSSDGKTWGAAALAGSVAGTLGGYAVATVLRPTAGQVSLIDAGYVWSGVLTGLVLASVPGDVSDPVAWGAELAVTNLTGLGMGLLSQRLELSRGRVLLIDAGGLVGGLAGMTGVFAASKDPSSQALAIGTGLGTIAGLVTSAWLTRDFDSPNLPTVAIAPVGPKQTAGATLSFRF